MNAMTPTDRPIQKWRRSYLYGWCRANDHDTLAWLFASKSGRETLRILREIKRTLRGPQRLAWPNRPTRYDELRPRSLRERLAIRIGPSLIERYDHELGAETLRSEAGWDEAVKARAVT